MQAFDIGKLIFDTIKFDIFRGGGARQEILEHGIVVVYSLVLRRLGIIDTREEQDILLPREKPCYYIVSSLK